MILDQPGGFETGWGCIGAAFGKLNKIFEERHSQPDKIFRRSFFLGVCSLAHKHESDEYSPRENIIHVVLLKIFKKSF